MGKRNVKISQTKLNLGGFRFKKDLIKVSSLRSLLCKHKQNSQQATEHSTTASMPASNELMKNKVVINEVV